MSASSAHRGRHRGSEDVQLAAFDGRHFKWPSVTSPPASASLRRRDLTSVDPTSPCERAARKITNEDLARFAGTYSMSSGMTFTFSVKANALELDASGEIMPLLYQGIAAGRPRFYVAVTNGEIEFVPDPTGAMTTVLWHQHGNEQTGKRR